MRLLQIFTSASLISAALAVAAAPPAGTVAQNCLAPGAWHTLGTAAPQPAAAHALLSDIASRDVVLLGEDHANADHHRWQLQTLSVLHALKPRMVIGLEAFPRRVQPVLDRWIAGELGAQEFLAQVEWEKVWNFPPELYLPVLEFARVNRIPMLALNVERTLTAAVRQHGWDAVPSERKEGLSRPAAASRDYVEKLFEVYKLHAPHTGAPAARRDDTNFRCFVEAQITWDRAFAQALVQPLQGVATKRPLVVGIMGSGHVRHRHGAAHQLRDLGVARIGTLLPVSARADCGKLEGRLADAVFAIPHVPQAKAPPRLGVRLEPADGAVRVSAVYPGSLAEASGIEADDRIVSVAGSPVSSSAAVAAAIRNASPGMWLPLRVHRGERTIEIVVRFPPKP